MRTELTAAYLRDLQGVDCEGNKYAEALAEAWAKALVNTSLTLGSEAVVCQKTFI